MSTAATTYTNSIQLSRGSILRWFFLLIASLALVAGVIMISASSVTADSSSGHLPSVVAIPVPTASTTDTQVLLTETATPAPSPTITAVPVPTPPSQ